MANEGLPPLEILDEDHAKYDAEWETRWDGYPVDAICAQLYCRERQLLRAQNDLAEANKAKERAYGRQKHTQEWYASHYCKLEDWARKILPEPWRRQFFNCIANGTYDHDDVGERYTCKAGFDVVPSGYIVMDDAKGQLILDQTSRAELAESALAEANRKLAEREWVRVEDRLPTVNELVRVAGGKRYPKQGMAACLNEHGEWLVDTCSDTLNIYPPKMWQPLPAPPEPAERIPTEGSSGK